MRRFNRARVDKAVVQIDSELTPEKVMETWVDVYGVGAAAWLVWSQRRRIRRHGACDFKIPRGAEVPPWFRIAVEYLRGRPDWSVVMAGRASAPERTYRVRWHAWGRQRARQPRAAVLA
jgi:hypothetical protein